MDYNTPMDTETLKAKMAEHGYTIATLAEKLGVGYNTLRHIMAGRAQLTTALSNHLELLFAQPREATLLYKVNLTEGKTAELLGDKACTVKEDYLAALEAVIHHNLTKLVERGAAIDWSDEERKALGLPPAGQPLPPGFIPEKLHLSPDEE